MSGFERNQAFTTRRQLLKPGAGRSRLLEKILPWGTMGGDFFQNPKGLALRGVGRWALTWPKWFKWRFFMGWGVIVNVDFLSFFLLFFLPFFFLPFSDYNLLIIWNCAKVKQPWASAGIVAAKEWSEARPVPQGGKRSGLQTLCARADCEYDRGLTVRADEEWGSEAGSGVYAEALAWLLIFGLAFVGRAITMTKANRGS